jgi:hypothetical protein
MENVNGQHQITRGILRIGCVTALAVACTFALPQAARAERVERPSVPDKLNVLGDNKPFIVGHATGTQNYVCVPSGAGFVWNLFTPEATLFTEAGRQIITHFFSPNPYEGGIVRATWQDSKDTSTFWGQATVTADFISDPTFVKQGAIPWVLLQFAGSQDGPTGGHRLTGTTFVQRVNTDGGSAPATGCAQATDVGKKAFIPYTADYFFYEHTNGITE